MRSVLIIPANDEEDRVGAVIEAALEAELFSEIVVVDDGSTDRTAEAAREAGARVVKLPINQGKGAAVQAGFKSVDADIITLSDADIIGLKPAHFEDMVRPLIEKPGIMMTVGRFSGGRLRTDLSQILVPAISGQRAMRYEFVKALPDLRDSRFGVELLITRFAKLAEAEIEEVILKDLTQVMKEEKLGIIKGVSARLRMYRDIYKVMRSG